MAPLVEVLALELGPRGDPVVLEAAPKLLSGVGRGDHESQRHLGRRTSHVRRPFSFFVPHSNLALKTKTTAAAAVAPLSGRGDSCRLCWRERLAAVHSIRPTTTVVHTRSFVAQVNAEGERGRQTFRCSRRSPPRSPLDRPSAAPSPVAALTHMVGPHRSGDHWWLRAAGAWTKLCQWVPKGV